MAISWNAHGSVEIWLLEHLYLDEFARDENMTRFRTVYLRSGTCIRFLYWSSLITSASAGNFVQKN